MSVATELSRIISAKAAIRAAIEAKGVTVPPGDTLEDFAAHIAAISTGPATAPAAFTAGQWTATAGNAQITINITALPSNGGSAITALQYRLNGGAAVTLSGTGTGSRTITGLTNATAYDVEIRAVNAIGNGAWSDVKNRTPVAPSGTAAWEAVSTVVGTLAAGGTTPTKPAGTVSTDLLVLVQTNIDTPRHTGMSVPSGWTLIGVVYSEFETLGHAMYWAPGSVADAAWTSTAGGDVAFDMHRISGASLSTPVRAFTTFTSNGWAGIGDADMPSPTATATAADLVLAHYHQPQDTVAVGAPTAGYTRRVDSATPNRRSTVTQANVAAGATGPISHNATGPYQARTSSTLVIASA